MNKLFAFFSAIVAPIKKTANQQRITSIYDLNVAL